MRAILIVLMAISLSCGDGPSSGGGETDPNPGYSEQDMTCFEPGLDPFEDRARNDTLYEAHSGNDESRPPRCEYGDFGASGEECEHLGEREGWGNKYNACMSDWAREEAWEGTRDFEIPCLWVVNAWRGDDGFCEYRALCATESQWGLFDWIRTWDETIGLHC